MIKTRNASKRTLELHRKLVTVIKRAKAYAGRLEKSMWEDRRRASRIYLLIRSSRSR